MVEKKLKFLGLGTIVEVDDLISLPKTKYVVIARAIGRNKDDSTLLRYMVAPHPFGNVPDQEENILRIACSAASSRLPPTSTIFLMACPSVWPPPPQ